MFLFNFNFFIDENKMNLKLTFTYFLLKKGNRTIVNSTVQKLFDRLFWG